MKIPSFLLVLPIILPALIVCSPSQQPPPDREVPPPDKDGMVRTEVDEGAAHEGEHAGHRPLAVPPPPVAQLVTGSPNTWFDKTKLFLGELLEKETVTGSFNFKNPTGKAQLFENLTGSCQCARAVITVGERKYTLTRKPVANSLHRIKMVDGKEVKERVTKIEIGAGESGSVEVLLEMAGLQGLKDATFSMTTTDPEMKQTTLMFQAKGVQLFTINPRDFFLNDMKWKDTRTFEFVVSSDVKPEFKLLDHDPLPEYVKISKAQIKLPDGKPAWKVSGTFGPQADPRAGGAAIKFKTDWGKHEVNLNVIATVTGPIEIKPGTFIPFGKVRKGKGAEKAVTITSNEGFDLKVEKVEFENLTIDRKYLKVSQEKKGNDLILTLKIVPEAMGIFLFHGTMLVHLNHPSLKSKKFNFNGILR